MNLSIFFITITIHFKKMTNEEHAHLQEIEQMYEETKTKQIRSGYFSHNNY
ncbi:YrzI family small protein [Niallia sp. Marseille-Q9988]